MVIPAPLRERDFVKAFILLMLCSFIGGFLAGAIIGGVLGAAIALVGGSMNSVQVAAPIVGGLTGICITYFFFRFLVLRLIVRKLMPFANIEDRSRAT